VRDLPGPVYATRNLSFWRFHRHRHTVVLTGCFTGMVRVGVKIPQDGNRANMYEPRGGGAWACLAHALQCLCDGRACCP
jgi:hypothetical protein